MRSTKTFGGPPFSPTDDFLPSHPPLPNDAPGVYPTLMVSESDLALTKRQFVKVSGEGEIEVDPNNIQFCVRIVSQKPDVNEAKASVQKREDYILGVFKKSSIVKVVATSMIAKACNIVKPFDLIDENDETAFFRNQIASIIPREKSSTQLNSYVVKRELNVTCDSMLKYLQVLSSCTEKLDQQVLISQPVIKFTPDHIQMNKQRCIRQAMENAQQKAVELIRSQKNHQNVCLGKIFYTMEDSMSVDSQNEYDDLNTGGASAHFEFFKWKRFGKRITCRVTTVFEIKTIKPRKLI